MTDESQTGTIDRRKLIKRGAIATGMVWAAPAITTIDRAMAQTSPGGTCAVDFTFSVGGGNCNASAPLAPTNDSACMSGTFTQCSSNVSATCTRSGNDVVQVVVSLAQASTCTITSTQAREVAGGSTRCFSATSNTGKVATFDRANSNGTIQRVRVVVSC